jgi:hypothetical protein
LSLKSCLSFIRSLIASSFALRIFVRALAAASRAFGSEDSRGCLASDLLVQSSASAAAVRLFASLSLSVSIRMSTARAPPNSSRAAARINVPTHTTNIQRRSPQAHRQLVWPEALRQRDESEACSPARNRSLNTRSLSLYAPNSWTTFDAIPESSCGLSD